MASESRPMTSEEVKKVFKSGTILASSALAFMILMFVLVQQEIIRLHPSKVDEDSLASFGDRMQYTIRFQFLWVLWLLINIIGTIYVRLTTFSIDPLNSSTEGNVQAMKNILTNSLESFILSAFAQYVFVSFASPLTVLKYIPLVNIIQFVGRFAFTAGYPLKRAFGYQCTIITNLCLVLYDLYAFGSFLGMY